MRCLPAEHRSSSSQNLAPPRRRDPLPAAPARSELPGPIFVLLNLLHHGTPPLPAFATGAVAGGVTS